MRILLVSQVNSNVFSGGRYHAFMIAEAFAELGHEPVYWATNKPLFWEDLAQFPNHEKVSLHLENWQTPPEGDFDLVLIVPDMSPSSEMYEAALKLAQEKGAKTGLLNFESPNWYNSTAPVKREVDKWRNWFAVSRYCDLILSSAAESTKFARDFYTQTQAWTNFRHAYPSINSKAADAVWDLNIPAEKRIMVISRFGGAAAHKGISDVEVLATPELAGYEVVCIVGTGAVPKEADIQHMKKKFASVGMTLSFLHGISDVHKFKEIARSSVMVFPTYFEGFGYPPIEALYMGRPCVTYDLNVLREVSGDLLTYCPVGDKAALRIATVEAIQNFSKEEGVEKRQGIAQVASLQSFAKRLQDIVDDIQKVGSLPAALSFQGKFDKDDYDHIPGLNELPVSKVKKSNQQLSENSIETKKTSTGTKVTRTVSHSQSSHHGQNMRPPGLAGLFLGFIERVQTSIISRIFVSRVNVFQRLMKKPDQRLRLITAIQRDKDFFDEIGHLWIGNSKNKQIALSLMGDAFEVPVAGKKLYDRAIKTKLNEDPDELFILALQQLRRNKAARRKAMDMLVKYEDYFEYLVSTVFAKKLAVSQAEFEDFLFENLLNIKFSSVENRSDSRTEFLKNLLEKIARTEKITPIIWAYLKDHDVDREALLKTIAKSSTELERVLQFGVVDDEISSRKGFEDHFLKVTDKNSDVRKKMMRSLVKNGLIGSTQNETLSILAELLEDYRDTQTKKSQSGLAKFLHTFLYNDDHKDQIIEAVLQSPEMLKVIFLEDSKGTNIVTSELSQSSELAQTVVEKFISERMFSSTMKKIMMKNSKIAEAYKDDLLASDFLGDVVADLAKAGNLADLLHTTFKKYPLREGAFFKEFFAFNKHRDSAVKELSLQPDRFKESLDKIGHNASYDLLWRLLLLDENSFSFFAKELAKGDRLAEFLDILTNTQEGAKKLRVQLENRHEHADSIKTLEADTMEVTRFFSQPDIRKRISVLSQAFVLWRRLHPHLKDSVKSEAVFANIIAEISIEEDIWPSITRRIVVDDVLRLRDGNLKVCSQGDLRILLQEILLSEEYFFKSEVASPVIIDGGANFGLAVYYFKKLYPTARIKAFEPGRSAFSSLKENVIRNGWKDVDIYPYALWNENGEMTFADPVNMAMGGSLTTRMSDKGYEVENYQVPVRKLSDFIEDRVDFLKLDIEGAEVQVLRDIESKLDVVHNIFIEIHGGYEDGPPTVAMKPILDILDRNGFECRISQAAASSFVKRPIQEIEKRSSLTLWAHRPTH